jgi:hypothetical protein
MDLAEQPAKRRPTISLIKNIVEGFAQRRDSGTARQTGVEKRTSPEGGFRDAATCQRDHVGGKVNPEDVVTRIGQAASPKAAAASEVNNEAGENTSAAKEPKEAGSGALGEGTEANVMDVGEVLPIGFWVHGRWPV